ncbi:hypothetical protein BDR07DRAFT_1401954 [Suillus spraguei]|nr:hypothetical protein BDR07DRAFT_1401954 [Suillus spraguei]
MLHFRFPSAHKRGTEGSFHNVPDCHCVVDSPLRTRRFTFLFSRAGVQGMIVNVALSPCLHEGFRHASFPSSRGSRYDEESSRLLAEWHHNIYRVRIMMSTVVTTDFALLSGTVAAYIACPRLAYYQDFGI